MKRIIFLLLGLLFITGQLLAQSRTITGQITDEQGKGISNASVTVRGSNQGTTTSADGSFSLAVPTNAKTLVVSSVGFQNQEVAIGGQTTLAISLQSQATGMETVVVTGYTRERRSQFSGAASVIGAKAVETVPVGSFDQALQGRAPGLLVNSGSGQPGSTAQVRIRGVQSIQGSTAQPLYVIDGIPVSPTDFQSINPNDFESITVLKDANAAAIYGARGGTGVIVITTKKGRAGGTNFTIRSQVGLTQPPDFSRLNMMNTREILEYEERIGLAGATTNTPGWVYSPKNPANTNLPATSPAGNPFAPSVSRYAAILDSIRGIDMNYADLFYRQGISQTHELSMSGGSERTRFYLSGHYFNQEGIDLGSALRRYATRFNIDHTVNNLTVQLNSLVGFSKTNFAEGEWLVNSARNPFQMTYRAKPYENPYKADGTLNFGPSTPLNLRQVANLLEGIQNSFYTQHQIKINGGLTVAYRIVPALTLKNTFGVDAASDIWQHYIAPASYYGTSIPAFNAGEDRESYARRGQLINTTSAVFSQRFNNIHEVEAGAYFEVVRGYQRALGFTLFNLDPRLYGTGQGAGALPTNNAATYPQNASSASSGFGIRSYFATGRYTYNNRYTFNANVRTDGTSRIVNPENREISTWSAGFTWNAMQEDFMKNQNILSDLRVRITYGIVPNIGSIATSTYTIGTAPPNAGTLPTVTNYQGPQVPNITTTNTAASGNAQYAGSSVTGQVPSSPGNPDYRIEKVKKANIGVDVNVWRNRARFTVDLYRNETIDLFVTQPLSGTTGFATLDINAGVMTNKGVEFTAAVDVFKQGDFSFTLGLNHAYNKNNIESLGAVNEYELGTFLIRTGLPFGTHYSFHYLGADPATGRPRYETADGKETLDAAQAGRFAKFGSFVPEHVGGFTGELRFNRFSVDALFSYQFGVVRSNNQRSWITRGIAGYHEALNASRELLTNQWQKPGDNAFFQSPLYDRGFTSSDLEDAKFLRFRNLNMAYHIPAIKVGENSVIKSARFYIQAQNLAIWSPWRGLDPEDNNNISLNEYPNPKMFVTGIDINF